MQYIGEMCTSFGGDILSTPLCTKKSVNLHEICTYKADERLEQADTVGISV